MLARVAANIYWMGRYLERAESMARLVGATRAMVLDLTGSREDHTRHWQHLLTITGNDDLFMTHGGHMDETGVIYFLISQDDHPGSLRSAVAMARENMRTLRDLFPREFWRHLNQLHRFLGEDPATLCNPDALPEALDEVIRHCHTLVGILLSTTSRDMVFDLLRLGQHIERADMTTRLLDLDPAHMGPEAGDTPWLHLLRSISAEPMYRRHVQPAVSAFAQLLPA
jgi:uncharacterized alpha-E superfamily protein